MFNRQIKQHLRVLMVGCLLGGWVMSGHAMDSVTLKQLVASPSRDYSTGPLWVWNDLLTEQQIKDTLQSLADQHVKQAWVHPRPGLMTPYLSEDWFRLWKVALAEAERLDMNIWIYDENSYPSGFAGGYVPKAMPESRAIGVDWREHEGKPAWTGDTIAMYRTQGDSFEPVTRERLEQPDAPQGKYLEAYRTEAGSGPWFGGTFYVDLLRPGVTQKFLEITMDAYKREIGDAFGKRMPGVFTDEPHLAMAKGVHWTPDLPEQYQARFNANLLSMLPSMKSETGDWKQVRHHYYQTLLDLFIERWAKPYYEYCATNGIEFTGHYWEHEWPNARSGPDNMAMYAHMQRPGIDILFNQYNEESVHAQFGNVRVCLELASAANQTGPKRTLCEVYGGGGWDIRFEDLKRIGDWISVLGVNTLNQHLSHITLRGARKGDYPVSFSYHAPWWGQYGILAEYFARVSAALSQGQSTNSVLVLQPTTTAWMYQGDDAKDQREALGAAFQGLVTRLAQSQIEIDLGSEDILANHGRGENQALVVGRQTYRTVVIPPQTENLNQSTVKLLSAFLSQGGTVLDLGHAETTRIDGVEASWEALTSAPGWKKVSGDTVVDELRGRASDGFMMKKTSEGGILYHMRRRIDDAEILFVVNTAIDAPVSFSLETPLRAATELDLETGESRDFAWPANNGITLPPCGSLMLLLARGEGKAAAPVVASASPVNGSDIVASRLAPNVLTLDFMRLAGPGASDKMVYFHDANVAAFKMHGLDRDPWEHAVQCGDELISMTFPADSGFEAEYRFNIEEQVPAGLCFVLERADLYTIACNGKPLAWDGQSWWLDKAFGKLDISALAKAGENVISIKAQPFTMFHELAPAYVLGDFSLRYTDKGFLIAAPQTLQLGPWKNQGLPLYGDAVAYERAFEVAETQGRFEIALPSWYGAVASVQVNGVDAGPIYRAPWTLDVSKHVQAGKNTVRVAVYGTPKNTLGPHHGNPALGIASPGNFSNGPKSGQPEGRAYSTLDYGLFAPFELNCIR